MHTHSSATMREGGGGELYFAPPPLTRLCPDWDCRTFL